MNYDDKSAYKILLVGQGLAGTILSAYLFRNGITHRVMDNNHHAAATEAAAGLINPITGRGYVKSWMIESLLDEAESFYAYMSSLLDMNLMHRSMVWRPLRTAQQVNKWHASTSRDHYDSFVKDPVPGPEFSDIIDQPLEYGCIDRAYQVDIFDMVKAYRNWLSVRSMVVNEKFDFKAMTLGANAVEYRGETYSHVIFCEGYQAVHNPFFGGLPFQPAKGEALEIEIPSLTTSQILRDEIFIVPLSNGRFWSGGSYIWQFEDHLPTGRWKTEWMEKLNRLINTSYTVVDHKAGIRPSVKGRRPLIGRHKDYSRLYIFNGLGTKGTSLGPYWAHHLVASHLIGKKPVAGEVDINRFEY